MINLRKVFILDAATISKARAFDFGTDTNHDALPQMMEF